jgi:hypothetical protein
VPPRPFSRIALPLSVVTGSAAGVLLPLLSVTADLRKVLEGTYHLLICGTGLVDSDASSSPLPRDRIHRVVPGNGKGYTDTQTHRHASNGSSVVAGGTFCRAVAWQCNEGYTLPKLCPAAIGRTHILAQVPRYAYQRIGSDIEELIMWHNNNLIISCG